MKEIQLRKSKLEHQKYKLALEEQKLKEHERKARVRHLIELGGLIVKAELEDLNKSTLYGALLHLKDKIKNNPDVINTFTNLGKSTLDKDTKAKTSVIVSFDNEPSVEVRKAIREFGLKYNRIRKEWYGGVSNIDELKGALKDVHHSIEVF